MKAVGMCLIVYGHVAHATTIPLTPPIYLKQLGVAFFLFATAFTLARETRPSGLVLFNRLFRVYLFGFSVALLMSAATLWTTGRLALSNYFPLLGGVNVVVDNFPANPTTWYLGTYLHMLLLWALVLRRWRARAWMVAAAVLVEVPMRVLLMTVGGGFIAYMCLTNWVAVFVFGLLKGSAREPAPAGSPVPFVAALLGGLALSAVAMLFAGLTPTFPLMTMAQPTVAGLLLVSCAVSSLYLGVTACTFEATRRLRAPAPVRFISRNSLLIVLAHMPIFYVLHPWLVSLGLTYWTRVGIQLTVLLPLLAAVSEVVVSFLQPDRLRGWVWRSISAHKHVHIERHNVSLTDSVGL